MGFSGISATELLIIAGILLLVFGSRKLRGLGADIGVAIRGFRNAMAEETEHPTEQMPSTTVQPANTDSAQRPSH